MLGVSEQVKGRSVWPPHLATLTGNAQWACTEIHAHAQPGKSIPFILFSSNTIRPVIM